MGPPGRLAPHPIHSMEELGALIASSRKVRHFTQQDLADLAGVGRRFIIELENGKPTAEIGKILSVLNTLGLDIAIGGR